MALLISSLYKQNKRAAEAALYINRIKNIKHSINQDNISSALLE